MSQYYIMGREISDKLRFEFINKYVKGKEILEIGSTEGHIHKLFVEANKDKKFYTLDVDGEPDFKMDLNYPKSLNKKFAALGIKREQIIGNDFNEQRKQLEIESRALVFGIAILKTAQKQNQTLAETVVAVKHADQPVVSGPQFLVRHLLRNEIAIRGAVTVHAGPFGVQHPAFRLQAF